MHEDWRDMNIAQKL